jgi:hypothetical protein
MRCHVVPLDPIASPPPLRLFTSSSVSRKNLRHYFPEIYKVDRGESLLLLRERADSAATGPPLRGNRSHHHHQLLLGLRGVSTSYPASASTPSPRSVSPPHLIVCDRSEPCISFYCCVHACAMELVVIWCCYLVGKLYFQIGLYSMPPIIIKFRASSSLSSRGNI